MQHWTKSAWTVHWADTGCPHSESCRSYFFAEHLVCLELLGRTVNDKHQLHCLLNSAKAVVQLPALWRAGTAYPLTDTQEKQGQCWQQGYSCSLNTHGNCAFMGAEELQPLAVTSLLCSRVQEGDSSRWKWKWATKLGSHPNIEKREKEIARSQHQHHVAVGFFCI